MEIIVIEQSLMSLLLLALRKLNFSNAHISLDFIYFCDWVTLVDWYYKFDRDLSSKNSLKVSYLALNVSIVISTGL